MARRPLLTDDKMLARARDVFVDQGYAARTRQVADAVGLTIDSVVCQLSGEWRG